MEFHCLFARSQGIAQSGSFLWFFVVLNHCISIVYVIFRLCNIVKKCSPSSFFSIRVLLWPLLNIWIVCERTFRSKPAASFSKVPTNFFAIWRKENNFKTLHNYLIITKSSLKNVNVPIVLCSSCFSVIFTCLSKTSLFWSSFDLKGLANTEFSLVLDFSSVKSFCATINEGLGKTLASLADELKGLLSETFLFGAGNEKEKIYS